MKELDLANTSFYDFPEMTGITETTDRHGLGVVMGPIDKSNSSATVKIAKSSVAPTPTINPSDDSQWSARWTPPEGSDGHTGMAGMDGAPTKDSNYNQD